MFYKEIKFSYHLEINNLFFTFFKFLTFKPDIYDMEEGLIVFVCIILLIVGILGTFLPILPGLLLSICGLLIYKFGTDADLSMIYIWAFGILTLASVVLSYVIPAKTNRKYPDIR